MKITLCSSASFFYRLPSIKNALENIGYEVLLPSMTNFHHLPERAFAKIQHNLIKEHFRKIDQSNAVYIANYEKKGIEGYIGGNVFLEMGKAFDREIPIFLMKDIPKSSAYKDELTALQPIVIGRNWNKLEELLRKGC